MLNSWPDVEGLESDSVSEVDGINLIIINHPQMNVKTKAERVILN